MQIVCAIAQRADELVARSTLEPDEDNWELVGALGRTAIMLGEWASAIEVLTPFVEGGPPRSPGLGVALCKLYRPEPLSPEYRRGQSLLEAACEASPKDADALASLAGTWKGVDDAMAHALCKRAVAADPFDSYAVGNLLEYEISERHDLSIVKQNPVMTREVIVRLPRPGGRRKNLPWAFFDIGKFSILLDRPYESIAAYAKAVQLSTARFMIETSLRSLQRLSLAAGETLADIGSAIWLLEIAAVAEPTGVLLDGDR